MPVPSTDFKKALARLSDKEKEALVLRAVRRDAELYDALSSLYPTETHDTYNTSCVLQAAKLLDTLLTIAPDDFQLREWLFVTDTIDSNDTPFASPHDMTAWLRRVGYVEALGHLFS